MTEMTTMAMAVYRLAAHESEHPRHVMEYDLALEKRQARRARRARWSQLRARRSVAARREAAISTGG